MNDGGNMNEIIDYSTECLKVLTDKFISEEIIYWIDFGTLLSAYRDGEMFYNDYDVDLCIFKYQKQKVIDILNDFQNKNKLTVLYGTEGNVIMLEFLGDNIKSRRFDIYICEKNKNLVQMCHYNNNYGFKYFYVDELDKIKLGSYFFNCPRHLSNFLRLRYGNSYMIPQYKCEELNKEWWELSDNVIKDKQSHVIYTSLVGDLFHEGHYNLLKRCKERFDKVIVGVHNDEQVMIYKPRPVDSYTVRLNNIKNTGFCDEIYENAPAITTQQLIDELSVDYVVLGREDQDKINRLYPVNPERLHLIERTPGVSTSILRKKFL